VLYPRHRTILGINIENIVTNIDLVRGVITPSTYLSHPMLTVFEPHTLSSLFSHFNHVGITRMYNTKPEKENGLVTSYKSPNKSLQALTSPYKPYTT
jgi:hypothetical protein